MAESSTKTMDLHDTLLRQAVSAASWFAVLDAAQEASAPQQAAEAGMQVRCLYEGEAGALVANVAPHLTTFDVSGEFANWLFPRWDRNVGILLQAQATFDEVRKHLRKFLIVKGPDGKTQYRLRYYDPRVLRAFLPVCTHDELNEFFGPIACFYAAGPLGLSVRTFRWTTRGMAAGDHAITPSPSPSQAKRAVVRLTVEVNDARGGAPIGGASVHVAGPVERYAMTDDWGEAFFTGLEAGEYEIKAYSAHYEVGQASAVLEPGSQVAALTCRAIKAQVQAT